MLERLGQNADKTIVRYDTLNSTTSAANSLERRLVAPLPRAKSAYFIASLFLVIILVAGCGSGMHEVANATATVPAVVVTGPTQVQIGTLVQYVASIAASSNSAVQWSINSIVGGSVQYGQISANGVYTPPTTLPAQGTVVVMATSADGTVQSGSLNVSLVAPPSSPPPPAPVISSATAAYNRDGSVLIDVIGVNFSSGIAVITNATPLPTTYISSTELHSILTLPPTEGATLPISAASSNGSVSTSYNLWVPASVSAASRILEQTSFGPTDDLIAHVQAVGLHGFVDEQIASPTSLMPDLPATLPARCVGYPAGCNNQNWWSNVLTGKDQLRQRVAFALGQIYAISFDQIDPNNLPPYVNAMANDAFGNWATIMKHVTLSPGMGAFLDLLNSGKPGPGIIANENYARENMQLFNLGLNLLNADGTLQLDGNGSPVPTFSEAQVEAFARAYTGWTYANPDGSSPDKFPNTTANYDTLLVPVESAHEASQKVLLTTTLPAGQTAQQDMDGAINDVFHHPNVGPFVCRQLIQHLVTSNPSPQYVERVATVFADNGSGVRGDMAAVIKAILFDSEARAGDSSPMASDGHLREPILWLTYVLRALGAAPRPGVTDNNAYDQLEYFTSGLSQIMFRPGSVFNFFPLDYQVPGTNLEGPEFGLETTATTMAKLSMADSIIFNYDGNLVVDLSATSPLGTLAASSNDALLDELSKLFFHGQMSTFTRTTILNSITPLTSEAQRARFAVYLVITSSEFKVEH